MSKTDDNKRIYDLITRTTKLGIAAIDLAKELEDNYINRPIINQFIRSATSIGANYMEADCAESRKDFFHKIGICRKEAKETIYWMDMVLRVNPHKKEICQKLKKEATELILIFSSIVKNKE